MQYEVYKLASQLPLQKKKTKKTKARNSCKIENISTQGVKLKHFCNKPEIEIELN